LRYAGSASTCSGKLTLTLTVKTTIKKGKKIKKISRTVQLGTGSFVIAAGKTVTVKLNAHGRALLKMGHGRLNARLTILKSSPSPSQTKAVNVTIVPQKTAKAKKAKN
jgi:hypothetical protein